MRATVRATPWALAARHAMMFDSSELVAAMSKSDLSISTSRSIFGLAPFPCKTRASNCSDIRSTRASSLSIITTLWPSPESIRAALNPTSPPPTITTRTPPPPLRRSASFPTVYRRRDFRAFNTTLLRTNNRTSAFVCPLEKPLEPEALLLRSVHHHIREPAGRLVVGIDRRQHLVCPAVLLYAFSEGGLPHHDDGVLFLADVLDRAALIPGAFAGELGHLEGLELDALVVERQEAHVLVRKHGTVRRGDDARELAYLPLLIHHVVLQAGGDEGGLGERQDLEG